MKPRNVFLVTIVIGVNVALAAVVIPIVIGFTMKGPSNCAASDSTGAIVELTCPAANTTGSSGFSMTYAATTACSGPDVFFFHHDCSNC
jgi:hypothetical protein